MNRLAMVALGAVALSGCAGTHIKKPAVCDGKHRRPANLYGTILPTLPVPLPASQAGGQSMVAPGPGLRPGALPAPPQGTASPMPAAPTTGATSSATKAPQISQREIALSYQLC